MKDVDVAFRAKWENHIMSACDGVIRSLHFQNDPQAQAKVMCCIKGKVDDVTVNLWKD